MGNKLKWFGVFILVAALLFGCSMYDDEGNANPPEENEDSDTDKDSDTEDPNSKESSDDSRDNVEEIVEAPYSFFVFEFEVDINGVNDAFEVEYEVKRSRTDASYTVKSEGIDIKDDEAMKKLEPMLDRFTFDENSSEDEILEQVLEGFSIDDYDEIEIEITFKDTTKIEFER